MKKIFALVAVLLAICVAPNDAEAQSRKEKKDSKKATSQSRGTKLIREECEELAMDITSANPRAAGSAISINEMMATNMALLDANWKYLLMAQLKVLTNNMLPKETYH